MSKKILIKDIASGRNDRYLLESVIDGTLTELKISTGAESITGTDAGALVSAKGIGTVYAAMPPLTFTRSTTVSNLRIGAWAGSAAAGSASRFSSAMDLHTDGQLDVAAVFGESVADLTSFYSAKAGRFRHLVSGSFTANQETYGLIGQVVVKSATLAHLHAGLMGTIEVNTAATFNAAYTYGVAGVIGRIGTGSGITDATKAVCGFSAFWNAAALKSGAAYAYAATSATSTAWAALLAADKCDNLLYVATASAYESGVKIAGSLAIDDAAVPAGFIRIYVSTTPYYIPVFSAGDCTNE